MLSPCVHVWKALITCRPIECSQVNERMNGCGGPSRLGVSHRAFVAFVVIRSKLKGRWVLCWYTAHTRSMMLVCCLHIPYWAVFKEQPDSFSQPRWRVPEGSARLRLQLSARPMCGELLHSSLSHLYTCMKLPHWGGFGKITLTILSPRALTRREKSVNTVLTCGRLCVVCYVFTCVHMYLCHYHSVSGGLSVHCFFV